jgi:hypothetical protein
MIGWRSGDRGSEGLLCHGDGNWDATAISGACFIQGEGA